MATKRMSAVMAAGLAAALAVTGCMREDLAGSTSTGNTGKGAIAGRVVDADGKGVAHARVRVVPVDHVPGPGGGTGEVADVVVTGADGAYETDSLPDGRYNLLSDKAGELAFRDSVEVSSDTATKLAGDTLKPPGSVAGVVRLQPGHDSRTVFLILPGTTAFAVPKDSAGNFKLANLAEGEYRLRLLSTLDSYKPMDTTIRVRSGADTVLADTFYLAYEPPQPVDIPVVDDIAMAYDTARMAATLTWKKRDPSRVAAYHVYRRHKDSAFARLTAAVLQDTVFTDDWKSGLVPNQVYHYAVTALDRHGNEGRKGDPAVLTVATRFQIDMAVHKSDCGVGKCSFDFGPDGSVWVAEANGAVVRHRNPGETSKWLDPFSPESMNRKLALDDAGDVYILYTNPLTVVKYSPAGDSLWVRELPAQGRYATLHMGGDTVYVWQDEGRVMTYLGKDGRLLAQETLLQAYSPAYGLSYPEFKPGIGFYTIVSGMTFEKVVFHDREGRDIDTWRPEPRGYLRDFTRGADGRWYASWSSHVVDVFSPERALLGSILAWGVGELRAREDGLYLQHFPGHDLVRITHRY